ncbi:MAG: hypothetical protein K2R98_28010 [Gemmataceae bacterium]|nr:hypothetical protein [Gemmataceae bacterium]
MSRRLAVVLLLLVAPCVAGAQEPERLLSADTQIYVRWDGIEPHRAAYEKTALGKMMQDDTGKFLAGVFKDLKDSAGTLLTVPQLLGGLAPEQLQKLQADLAEAPKLLSTVADRGFVVAVEVRKLEPPEGQVTLIFPGAGAQPKPFLSALRLLTTLLKVEAKETTIGERVVYHVTEEPVSLVWWIDGKDAVVVAGTDKAEAVVKRATSATNRLADNAQFKKVREFKEFETSTRLFLDGTALVKIAKSRGKEVSQLIDDLGLEGLKAIRLYSGFDGAAERGLVEVDMPGPRKGLLKLADSKPFKLSDVPPVPPDAISFSATRFSYGSFYDVSLQAVQAIVGIVSPKDLPAVKDAIKQADQVLGINIRNDLFGSLGDMLVTYNSPTDGPLNLGQVYLIQVKDAKKLQQTIDQALKGLSNLTGAEIELKKRFYRKMDVYEVHVKQQGFIFLPTYVVHDGWIALSYYPQPVQGFILRATGELPPWKPDAGVEATLAKLPKEFNSVSYSDPRPSIKQLLSMAPLIGQSVRSFAPDTRFDVGAIPNGHEATKHLFPNLSVMTDDGNTLRLQTRASLQLPFDVVGIDSYVLTFALFGLARGF